MSLVSEIRLIRETIKTRIEDHLGEDIENVIVGSKDKAHNFNPPFIWVIPADSQINDEGLALHEQWDLIFWIISIVNPGRDFDPDDARAEAETLALRASKSLMFDPATGKEDRHLNNLVTDITRVGWSPGDSRVLNHDESLFGAGVQIKVKFVTEESE